MNVELITKAAERLEAMAAKQTTTDDAIRNLTEKVAEVSTSLTTMAQKSATGFTGSNTTSKSLVQHIIGDDRFKAFIEGANSTGRISVPGTSLPMIRKDLLSIQGGGGSTGFDVQAQRDPRMAEDPRRPLTLLDVMQRVPVTSNAFEYVRLDGYANVATAQNGEGTAKAETELPTALQTAAIVTYAHFIRTSLQVVSDVATLQPFLQSLLTYGVLQKLEQDIVSGPGTGGRILGLTQQATAFTPVLESDAGYADAIGAAIAELSADGWVPSLVIMNPRTWHRIRSERGTDLQYVAGGWAMPAQPSVYNIPVVTTPSLEEGKALILDTTQVAVLDRSQPVFAISREDADNFTTNKVTMLAELRAGLAVFSPMAVLLADLY